MLQTDLYAEKMGKDETVSYILLECRKVASYQVHYLGNSDRFQKIFNNANAPSDFLQLG